MIKLLTACTYELDDSEKAVRDILEQLDLKNGLLKNSVALLFSNIKFIEAGVTEAVGKSLPFDVLGCTSQYFAISARGKSAPTGGALTGGAGEIMLTVTVLTSDDTEFVTNLSEALDEKTVETKIESLYRNSVSSPGTEPSLIFAFLPTMTNLNVSGDVMTAILDRTCGGIPVFGTLAVDLEIVSRNPRTIYKGAAYEDRIALLLFKGPVKPKFFSFTFPGKPVFTEDAVITKAESNRLFSINNRPAVPFLKEFGLLQDDTPSPAIPLIVETPDGSGSKVTIMHGIENEEVLICSRQIPVGGIVSIGMVTADSVLESMHTLIQDIKKEGGGTGLFIFSCILRAIVLGGTPVAEVELMQKELTDFPGSYLYFSSGGELCPRLTPSGDKVNGSYEYALIACQF